MPKSRFRSVDDLLRAMAPDSRSLSIEKEAIETGGSNPPRSHCAADARSVDCSAGPPPPDSQVRRRDAGREVGIRDEGCTEALLPRPGPTDLEDRDTILEGDTADRDVAAPEGDRSHRQGTRSAL